MPASLAPGNLFSLQLRKCPAPEIAHGASAILKNIALLQDPNTFVYVCGLKAMEEGVVLALKDAVQKAGQDWESIGQALKREGRLHLETY